MGLIDFRRLFAGGWHPMHFPQSSGVDFGDWFADGHRRACGFVFGTIAARREWEAKRKTETK
jgi:hypothetical protein